jgi:hypothetical protein
MGFFSSSGKTAIMQRWVERPEARWAFWAGILGAGATAIVSTPVIVAHGSVLGFVVLPLIAAVVAVPAAVWGAALGHVVLHLRGRAPEPRIVFWAALVAALSVPAAVAYTVLFRNP